MVYFSRVPQQTVCTASTGGTATDGRLRTSGMAGSAVADLLHSASDTCWTAAATATSPSLPHLVSQYNAVGKSANR